MEFSTYYFRVGMDKKLYLPILFWILARQTAIKNMEQMIIPTMVIPILALITRVIPDGGRNIPRNEKFSTGAIESRAQRDGGKK